MQPLVPLVFHNLPFLYPPSFRRNYFLYLFYPFLTVLNAPSKTMLEYRCSTRGSNSDRTVTKLRYKPLHSPVINLITRVRAGEVGVAHYPKWRRSLLIRPEIFTRDVGWEQERSLGVNARTPLTIVDQFGIKIRGFTLLRGSSRLLKKKNMTTKIRESRMSDFSCEKTKVCMDS